MRYEAKMMPVSPCFVDFALSISANVVTEHEFIMALSRKPLLRFHSVFGRKLRKLKRLPCFSTRAAQATGLKSISLDCCVCWRGGGSIWIQVTSCICISSHIVLHMHGYFICKVVTIPVRQNALSSLFKLVGRHLSNKTAM